MLAQTRLEWARLLRQRAGPADHERATALAAAAAMLAAELDAPALERRAREFIGP